MTITKEERDDVHRCHGPTQLSARLLDALEAAEAHAEKAETAHAASVKSQNDRLEATERALYLQLNDAEARAEKAEVACAGMREAIERLMRLAAVYSLHREERYLDAEKILDATDVGAKVLEELTTLRADLRRQHAIVQTGDAAFAELKEERDALRAENEKLEAEAADDVTTLDALARIREENDRLTTENERLVERLTLMRSRRVTADRDLEALRAENERLKAEVSFEHKAYEQVGTQANEQIAALRSAATKAKAALVDMRSIMRITDVLRKIDDAIAALEAAAPGEVAT